MQSTRRRVLPDPTHHSPKPAFILAEHGHTHSHLAYYLFDPRLNRIHLVDGYAHPSPSKSVAWSAHGIVATGLASGAVHLLDVERWTRPRDAEYVNAEAGSYSGAISGQGSNAGSLGTLGIRHNRACNALAFSKVDPHYLVAGYDKTRSECSLMVWDLELALAGTYPSSAGRRFPLGSEGRLDIQFTSSTSAQPIQQLLPSETINAVDTLADSVSLILASSNGKTIRLLDLRTRLPSSNTSSSTPLAHQPAVPSRLSSSLLGTTPPPTQAQETNVAWSTQTRATYHLTSSPRDPHLFASAEEGLGGTVRLWDTRYERGDVLNFEAARGGIIHLAWDEDSPHLGVGTRDGGVLVYDVVGGALTSHEGEGQGEHEGWAALTHVRGASRPVQSLASFTFLPSARKATQHVLSVCRDATMFVDTLRGAPNVTTASRVGDAAFVREGEAVPTLIQPQMTERGTPPLELSSGTRSIPQPVVTAPTPTATPGDTRRSVSRGRQPEGSRTTLNIKQLHLTDSPSTSNAGTAWRHPWVTQPRSASRAQSMASLRGRRTGREDLEDVWGELLGEDVGVLMRRKAEEGFGLDVSSSVD